MVSQQQWQESLDGVAVLVVESMEFGQCSRWESNLCLKEWICRNLANSGAVRLSLQHQSTSDIECEDLNHQVIHISEGVCWKHSYIRGMCAPVGSLKCSWVNSMEDSRRSTTTTTTTLASSTAGLIISNKLNCFIKQAGLFIQHSQLFCAPARLTCAKGGQGLLQKDWPQATQSMPMREGCLWGVHGNCKAPCDCVQAKISRHHMSLHWNHIRSALKDRDDMLTFLGVEISSWNSNLES